ncbi:hypothetical protein L9F63_011199 [Diploptera punctata]|uniref:Uncharacterized protein n=1 Tax=Diploptera punctata TaxID=6984 RepID=A0AAD8EQA7_DIPPU|nr:hypothetical protein L9F63_011199 [Diploptera punctata]
MAASMNDSNKNDGIEEPWEVGCASLVPEKSKLRYEKKHTFHSENDWRRRVVL